jgi:hypothetical protein
MDLCEICEKPVYDYEPEYCCSGRDCGCMGQPTEPCVCSQECSHALFNGIGKTYEQRRIDAGIKIWKPASFASEGVLKSMVQALFA